MQTQNELTPETKQTIDAMTYEEMLRIWRFGPTCNINLLQGETGEYFKNEMFRKKDKLTHEQQVAISKQIGW